MTISSGIDDPLPHYAPRSGAERIWFSLGFYGFLMALRGTARSLRNVGNHAVHIEIERARRLVPQ
jgi:hypothetical protein